MSKRKERRLVTEQEIDAYRAEMRDKRRAGCGKWTLAKLIAEAKRNPKVKVSVWVGHGADRKLVPVAYEGPQVTAIARVSEPPSEDGFMYAPYQDLKRAA